MRFGKVKTPNGLFNDIQRIDPAFIWSSFSQLLYPITGRATTLAHYGGVAYGNLPKGRRAGKPEYQFYASERVIPENDGFLVPIQESNAYFPDCLNGPTRGGMLRWHTPVDGLLESVALDHENRTGPISVPGRGLCGNNVSSSFHFPLYYGKYEHDKVILAASTALFPVTTRPHSQSARQGAASI